MPVITNAGEYLITQQQQAGEPLIIDQMILANITGLDSNTVPSRDQSMPAPADVKIIKPITKDGLLNTNTVVYSTVFPSTDGTFDFNYMGLYSSAHDVIVAVAYVPLQTKIKTVGTDVGNVITKNFAIEFNAAADITGINISAESWQIDYTARLLSMDKNQRDLIKNIYGPSTFLNDAFKVKFETDKYYLTAGKAILGGINFDLEADLEIVPGALPQTVWLDVYQETSMMGVLNKHDVVINDGTVLTDYVVGSVEHTLVKLGVVNSSVDIVDGRSLVKRSLELTTKNNDPKNIAELRKYRPEYVGQKLDIDGHTLPGIGGGPFYHDPDDSNSPDNNGTVIVNEWGDVWKRKKKTGVYISDFGVVPVLSDQFYEVQAASDYAHSIGSKIVIDISFYSDTNLNGTIIIKSDTEVENGAEVLYKDQLSTIIKFTSGVDPIAVDPANIGGLSEYSKRLTGLAIHKANDFLIVKSDEKLIDRIGSPASLYRKNECLILGNEEGMLSTQVEENYNLGSFGTGGVYLYKFKSVISVSGLTLNTFSGDQIVCNVNGIIVAEHCYLTTVGTIFKNIRNTHTQWLNIECPVTIHENPVMEGDYDNAKGYGISNFITGMCLINNAVLGRFRHSLTGRHDKNTIIKGGFYESDIDSHYGYGMIVEGVSIHGTVTFAGRDLSFTKSRSYMTSEEGIYAERSDAPEIRGSVVIEDIDVYANLIAPSTDIYLVRCGAQSEFTFSNPLKKPDYLALKNIRLHNVSGFFTIKYIQHLRSDEYNYSSYGKIVIDNVQQIQTNNTAEAIAFFTKGDTQTWTRDTIIELRNLSKVSTRMYNTETVFDPSYGYKFNIDNIERLVLKVDRDCVKGGTISNTSIAVLSNGDSGTTKADKLGTIKILDGCKFTYSEEQDLQSILRGNFKIYMLKDSVIDFDLQDISSGTIEILPDADPYVAGKANFDTYGNYVNLIWCDTTYTSQLNVVQNSILTGAEGLDNDVSVSCKDGKLYLENRRGTEGFLRGFYITLLVQ